VVAFMGLWDAVPEYILAAAAGTRGIFQPDHGPFTGTLVPPGERRVLLSGARVRLSHGSGHNQKGRRQFFFGALAYSVISPCALLIPVIRADMGSVLNLRRLQILAFYGEGPHTASLAFIPFGDSIPLSCDD